MQTFLTTCLWATFIATGVSLSCESCSGLGHTCEGPLKVCPPDEDTCGALQMKISGVLEAEAIVKTCLHSTDCSEPIGSIDFATMGHLFIQVTCCVGSECEKRLAPLPPVDKTPNGSRCPVCYAVNSFECLGVDAECRGDNIYCAELTGTGNVGNVSVPFALKGCTNQVTCHNGHEASPSDFFSILSCTSHYATSSTSPGSSQLFLQTLAGLLLLKILVCFAPGSR